MFQIAHIYQNTIDHSHMHKPWQNCTTLSIVRGICLYICKLQTAECMSMSYMLKNRNFIWIPLFLFARVFFKEKKIYNGEICSFHARTKSDNSQSRFIWQRWHVNTTSTYNPVYKVILDINYECFSGIKATKVVISTVQAF